MINNAFRTSTVVQLCLAMRQERDYSACPVLADALQDAGCPDDDPILAALRDPNRSAVTSERLVAQVMSQAGEDAVKWMDELLVTLGPKESYNYADDEIVEGELVTYEELMIVAHLRQDVNYDQGTYSKWNDYIQMGANEGYKQIFWGKEQQFWRRFETITGIRPRNLKDSFFTCGC